MSYWVVKLHQTGPEPRSITKYAGPFSTIEEAEKKELEVSWQQATRPRDVNNLRDVYFSDPIIEVWTDEQIELARRAGHYIY